MNVKFTPAPFVDTNKPTPDQVLAMIDHLQICSDELLITVKQGITGKLDIQARLQLAADAAMFNTLAAQLGLLALGLANTDTK